MCSRPIPTTHKPTSIEYKEEVRHLPVYWRFYELTQSKLAGTELEVEDLHSREGSIP